MDKRYYMHAYTGNVATEDDWILEITDDEPEDGTTKKEAFDEYVKERIFIEVKKGIDGEWVEA